MTATTAHRLAAGTLAGAIAGLLMLGGGGRVAMYVIAVQGGQRPIFTLRGTAALLIIGTVIGAPAGALFNAARHRVPWPRLAQGAAFAATYVVFWVALEFIRVGGPATGSRGFLPAATLAVPLIAFAMLAALLCDRAEALLPSPRGTPRSLAAYVLLGLVALAGVAAYVVELAGI